MSDSLTKVRLGDLISELPKSTLPAAAAEDAGPYLFYCSSSTPKRTGARLQDKPAILMGTGGVASIHFGQGEFSYSTDTWAFRIREQGNLLQEFAYRVLEKDLSKIDYAGFEGSGLRHLRKNFIRNYVVHAPDISVQAKTCNVFSTIDAAIEQTETLIEKYQHIKAGLMHDLFNRGVLPNGQLRPPREQAPDLYQKTAIGWIPNEWTLVELESLLAPVPNNIRSGPFGSALLKGELVETGIPFLGIDNIHVECFNDDFRRFVSPKKFTELAKYAVRKKDVIITIMGTVGRCCVVPETVEVALSSKHLWTMTFDLEKVIPRLICWQLNYSAWVKSWFRRATQGGIMDAIQSSTLKRLVLPVPAMDEQLRIDVHYGFLTSRIDSEEQKLQKLRLKKLGLMKALFTDKVII